MTTLAASLARLRCPGLLCALCLIQMTFENTFYLLSLSLLIVCSECFLSLSLRARDFYLSKHVGEGEEGVMPWWGPAGRCFAVSLLSGVVGIPTVFNFWRFVAALNGLLAVIVAGCVDEAPFVRCCCRCCLRQTIRIRIFVSESTSTHPNPHPHPSTTRSCQQLFFCFFYLFCLCFSVFAKG